MPIRSKSTMDINAKGISRAVQIVPGVAEPVVQGIPKSGRSWKPIQRARSSSQLRKGPLRHMSKSFDQRKVEKVKMAEIKALGNRTSLLNSLHLILLFSSLLFSSLLFSSLPSFLPSFISFFLSFTHSYCCSILLDEPTP